MRTVHTGPAIGLVAQLALLTVLAGTVSLSPAGWVVGIACGLSTNVLLARGLARSGATALGPANRVTLTRATLVGGIAALVADSFGGSKSAHTLVAMAVVALILDAVDGWVARRTGTVSPLGARFDMEVDAFLILILSGYLAGSTGAWWVLTIGLARYAFVAAGWLLPWLRGSLPPRYWRKVVAAIQGVVLTVAAADVLPQWVTGAALAVAAALLAESFGRDVWWLWRHRAATDENVDTGAQPVPRGRGGPMRPGDRSPVRTATAGVTTTLACVLVWFALVAPSQASDLTPVAFLRIPLEGLLIVALLLVLPPRPRGMLVALVGVALGALTLLKIIDMGFYEALDRPFNPVTDWTYLGPAVALLSDSIGGPGALATLITAGFLTAAILILMPLAVRRLTRIAGRHRSLSIHSMTALGVVWVLCFTFGLQLVANTPIASSSAAALTVDEVRQVRDGVRDQQTFATAISVDPVSSTPGSDLLTALRGKDVVVAFVESYGRVALQDSAFAARVDATLDSGTSQLRAAGFSSRSAFLTSPTFGGISWLAHSTFQSGLWVDSQQRYDQLVAGNRMTLSVAFKRAGWRTVGDVPSNERDWPEGRSFYHYDQVYDESNVGYRGPNFSYASMPDQYVLSAFHRLELAPVDRGPVMAEIDLVSSHSPWAPLPSLIDWAQVGDGSVFDGMPEQGQRPDVVWQDPNQVRAAYGQSIEYTLNTLVSFVQTYGDDNLVLIVLGDHQPATIVSGDSAGHDVPISIVARDPAVLDRIAGWGWQDGLRPGPQAPVWPMNTFRDRFLTAFGP